MTSVLENVPINRLNLFIIMTGSIVSKCLLNELVSHMIYKYCPEKIPKDMGIKVGWTVHELNYIQCYC